jgi:membrane-bound lytic murein transglycosylase B
MGIWRIGRSAGTGRPRHRWLLVAALVLAWAGFIGGVNAQNGGDAGLQEADAETSATTPQQDDVSSLSRGAPKGALTLPAAPVPVASPQPATPVVITGLASNGIPNVALNAYRVGSTRMNASKPGCGIDWSLIAAIGRVESNHGRFRGATLNPDGTSTPEIRGPALDGGQFAFIGDSDGGRFDHDSQYDRAVGPMQFIPTTWRSYAVDGDGNGTTDPFDIDDAALGAANYLCVAGGDLRNDSGQRRAVFAYNHSDQYVAQVLALARAYASGIAVDSLPLQGDTTSPVPPPSGDYRLPAAPGPALGARDRTPASGDTVPFQPGGSQPAAQEAGQPAPAPGGPAPAAPPPGTSGTPQSPTGGTSPQPAPAPAPAAPAPAPANPLPAPLPAAPLPLPPAPVPAPSNPVPPAPPPPAVVYLPGTTIEAVVGVTCDTVALTPLPDCPPGARTP